MLRGSAKCGAVEAHIAACATERERLARHVGRVVIDKHGENIRRIEVASLFDGELITIIPCCLGLSPSVDLDTWDIIHVEVVAGELNHEVAIRVLRYRNGVRGSLCFFACIGNELLIFHAVKVVASILLENGKGAGFFAIIIGIFQVIAAIFPGTSRSGATIIGALLIGVSRIVSAEYTFYLAIPAMLGASVLKIAKYGLGSSSAELMILAIGTIVAFAVSMFIIKFLMNYIKKHDFKVFGWYRIALGILVIVLSLANVI